MEEEAEKTTPSTVNDWFKDTANHLRSLYYRLKEQVLAKD